MAIEVTNKDKIIRTVEKEVEIRGVLGGEGGVRGKVEVDDFQGRSFPGYLDPINL